MALAKAFLARFGPVPVVDGAPAEWGEPELVPGDNLPTVVVPGALDAYLHVIMPDLTADDLWLDLLLIYLYETRSLQHQQAVDHQETHHQRRDQYSVCHAQHYLSIHRMSWKKNSRKSRFRILNISPYRAGAMRHLAAPMDRMLPQHVVGLDKDSLSSMTRTSPRLKQKPTHNGFPF